MSYKRKKRKDIKGKSNDKEMESLETLTLLLFMSIKLIRGKEMENLLCIFIILHFIKIIKYS